jgi:hypothetical protein
MSLSDSFITYKIIKALTTPFEKWDAFEMGLIDKNGETLKAAQTKKERETLPKWLLVVKNLKKLLGKLPGGKTKLGSFASALWLMKEELQIDDITQLEEAFVKIINSNNLLIESENSDIINIIVKGRYLHEKSTKVFILKEDIEPVGYVFNVPVFKLVDMVTEKEIYTTPEEIRMF